MTKAERHRDELRRRIQQAVTEFAIHMSPEPRVPRYAGPDTDIEVYFDDNSWIDINIVVDGVEDKWGT